MFLASFRFLVAVTILTGTGAFAQNVTTYRYDNRISGVNAKETVLKPANVTLASFGQLFKNPIDGQAYAQPLYLSHVTIPGKGMHNIVYVATCHDTVYAFDADVGGDPLWVDSFLAFDQGITGVPQPDVISGDIMPEIGIVGTPVIDAASGTLYVVAKTRETGRGDNQLHYVQKLHALDVATGKEKFNRPSIIGDTTRVLKDGTYDYNLAACPQTPNVKGKGDGNIDGTIWFNAMRENQRASLALDHGIVYVTWSSHGDVGPYHGWIIGFNAKTLVPMPGEIFCTTPDGGEGGIWQAGCGPVIDARSNIYFSTGNGLFDGDRTHRNWSQTFLKLATQPGISTAKGPGGPNATFDCFAPYNELDLSNHDIDVGSGGMTMFDAPGTAFPHLIVGSCKVGSYYVMNRENLGGFDSTVDNVLQKFEQPDGREIMTTPVFFNKAIFYNRNGDSIRVRRFAHGRFSDAYNRSEAAFSRRGGGPIISANGTKDGVLWIIDNGYPASLKAYSVDALSDLLHPPVTPLYEGTLPDGGVKFTHPVVINGKVYGVSATRSGNAITSAHLVAFGLLANNSAAQPETPTHLTAISKVPTGVTVSWVAHDYATTGFIIKRGDGDSGALTQIGTAGRDDASFNDNTVVGATRYRYTVAAINRNGTSPDSESVTIQSHDYLKDDGLIAYWNFDEGKGTVVNDLTANGHAGKTVGEVSWSPGIRDTLGLDFHGTGNAKSHVEIKEATDLPYGGDQSFSVVAWARPASVPDHWAGLVTKSRETPSGWFGIYLSPDGHWSFRGAEEANTISGGVVMPNSWQQIIAVQDGAAKTRTLYMNGSKVATSSITGMGDAKGPLWIGQGNADEESFAGAIDDVRIYNRALDAGDITKLYGSYLPSITLTDPVDGATLKAGDTKKLWATARANAPGASVGLLTFYQGDKKLGDSHDSTGHLDWHIPSPGDYVLTATVADSNGNGITSAPVHVKVTP